MIITNGKQITTKEDGDDLALLNFVEEVFGDYSREMGLSLPLDPLEYKMEDGTFTVPKGISIERLLDQGAELVALHQDDVISKPGIISTQVKHIFTPEELEQQADQMARNIIAQQQLKEQQKEVNSSFKAKQAELEATNSKLSNWRSSGYDHRDADVKLDLDFGQGRRKYLDPKTNAVLKEEDLWSDDFKYRVF